MHQAQNNLKNELQQRHDMGSKLGIYFTQSCKLYLIVVETFHEKEQVQRREKNQHSEEKDHEVEAEEKRVRQDRSQHAEPVSHRTITRHRQEGVVEDKN